MDFHPAVAGFECLVCGVSMPAAADPRACPDCGGPLELAIELDTIECQPVTPEGRLLERSGLAALLGLTPATDLKHGETPLVAAPALANDLDVKQVAIKDEARNPSGSLTDREASMGVAAARAAGADTVALPTTGAAGVAVAMAAARAGVNAHAFVPSRASFVHKAMTNVHGGEMTVVEGRYPDAAASFRNAELNAYSLAPFATPFRRAGVKPLAYEIAAARNWSAPDILVLPTGQVSALVGISRGFSELETLGLISEGPRLIAAQAAACAPLANAVEACADRPMPVEHPDTVVGALEVSDPAGAETALKVIRESDGTAVAVDDEAILDGARQLAEAGLPASATGGAALAAAQHLETQRRIGPHDEIVLVNPVAAATEADLLRSHLMRRGG